MSIYTNVDPGTKVYRSRFNLSYRKLFDCDYGALIPVMAKFVLPGDIWKISGNLFLRYQPTLSPSLTKARARVRYFFVPLRLSDDNAEEIITGSKNGKVSTGVLPKFANFCDPSSNASHNTVSKYGFWDYMGIPCLNYDNIRNEDTLPAQYWLKSYLRIWFDYYRDENLQSYADFDSFYNPLNHYAGAGVYFVNIKKDYLMSSLPFQLKGVAPTIAFNDAYAQFKFGQQPVGNVSNLFSNGGLSDSVLLNGSAKTSDSLANTLFNTDTSETSTNIAKANSKANQVFTAANNVVGANFNMDQFRDMVAQTRIFERLARCGSRYIEYLQSNFQISPRDDTLQRPQYLGGFTIPIVQTEVVQSAADGSNPVGTLRGHGITNGGNSIPNFVAKEFGVVMGLMDILPYTQYTQGIKKEYTYKSRFDFFNPSFQHLSEQEVKNAEIFVSNSDGLNGQTFGFQAYANELRSSQDEVCADLRDTLGYWTQAIQFNSRPNLNSGLIYSQTHLGSYNRPFAVVAGSKPLICDFKNDLDVYRPMVRYSTPGLVDHL